MLTLQSKFMLRLPYNIQKEHMPCIEFHTRLHYIELKYSDQYQPNISKNYHHVSTNAEYTLLA